MKPTYNQLEEAKAYINYGVKEGNLDESDFEDLTDEEFVAKARELMDRGDYYANSMKGEE